MGPWKQEKAYTNMAFQPSLPIFPFTFDFICYLFITICLCGVSLIIITLCSYSLFLIVQQGMGERGSLLLPYKYKVWGIEAADCQVPSVILMLLSSVLDHMHSCTPTFLWCTHTALSICSLTKPISFRLRSQFGPQCWVDDKRIKNNNKRNFIIQEIIFARW